MVIEFIGTPGSGKTTFLPVLYAHLEATGLKPYSVLDAARIFASRTIPGKLVQQVAPESLKKPLLWQVFYLFNKIYRVKFRFRHSKLVQEVHKAQASRPNQQDIKNQRILHWFNYLIGSYEFLTQYQKSNEVLIFDEGFVHRVVQFNASDIEEPNFDKVKKYIDLIPSPNIIFFINTSPEKCETRVLKRGVWRFFDNKSASQISKFITNSAILVDMTVDYLRDLGWNVIEINNDQDLETPSLIFEKALQDFRPTG